MSIRQFIDANSIANEIRMERQVNHVTFLLVEGVDDKKLFAALVQSNRCSIVIAYGKERLIEIISILNGSDFRGVVAIADRDFDTIEGIQPEIPNLILTADHVSRRMRLHLDFDGIEYRFIDRSTLSCDLSRLTNQVISRTKVSTISREDLERFTQAEVECTHDGWQVCVGHDIICILSLGLRSALGSCRAQEVQPDLLESQLRMAFSLIDFHTSELFHRICKWEYENSSFRFLKGPCPDFL